MASKRKKVRKTVQRKSKTARQSSKRMTELGYVPGRRRETPDGKHNYEILYGYKG